MKNCIKILLCCTIVFSLSACAATSKTPDFKKVYNEILSADELSDKCVALSKDSKSLVVDTNPNNDKNQSRGEAVQNMRVLLKVNELLGLPDALIDKIGSTRELDGQQVNIYGEITITWSYHPDYGLKVIYEKKS